MLVDVTTTNSGPVKKKYTGKSTEYNKKKRRAGMIANYAPKSKWSKCKQF